MIDTVIAGLTWDCFSFDFKTLRIDKTWDTLQRNGFADTKDEQSKRLIKITDHLADILKSFHVLQIVKLKELGIDNPLDLIFINQYGRVPDNTSANQTLHRVLKRIGQRYYLSRTTPYTRLVFNLQGCLNLLYF